MVLTARHVLRVKTGSQQQASPERGVPGPACLPALSWRPASVVLVFQLWE